MAKKDAKKVPVVRFKGFTEDWNQLEFGDVIKFSVSNNTISRAGLNYTDGEIKNIHYGDILVKFSSVLDVTDENVPYITDGKIADYKTQLLRNGDVILADTAEDETTGKAIEVTGINEQHMAVSGLHTMIGRANIDFAPKFLGYYLNSPSYQQQLLKLMQGVKVLSLSKRNVAKTEIIFPQKAEEQQKIGAFFHTLDQTIALHQHELDLLKKQKKVLLQKMFPQKGEVTPEIRFSNFTEDWEQRKLTDVASYRNGKAHEQDIDEFGKYVVVNSKFVSTEGRITKHTNKLVEPLKKGEIAFVLSDVPNGKAIAKAYLVGKDDTYSLNQRIAGITPKPETDSYFLFIRVNRNSYFLKFDNGVGQTNLSKKDVETFVSKYPSLEEQHKIGAFFQQLDQTITLHQHKLENLKKLKKSFLEKMFI